MVGGVIPIFNQIDPLQPLLRTGIDKKQQKSFPWSGSSTQSVQPTKGDKKKTYGAALQLA